MRKKAVVKEVPDNTVFWSVVGIVSVFVIVLAAVMVVRTGTTGEIVQQWPASKVFAVNPYACLDVPACGDSGFMCCAETVLPGSSIKCVPPMFGYDATGKIGYKSAYNSVGYGNKVCPKEMPYRCGCPEKFQYKLSYPIP